MLLLIRVRAWQPNLSDEVLDAISLRDLLDKILKEIRQGLSAFDEVFGEQAWYVGAFLSALNEKIFIAFVQEKNIIKFIGPDEAPRKMRWLNILRVLPLRR